MFHRILNMLPAMLASLETAGLEITGLTEDTETVADIVERHDTSRLGEWLQDKWGAAMDLLVRVAIALVVFIVATRILKKLLQLMERAMERRSVEATVRHFVLTLTRLVVFSFLIVTIIVQLNIVEATSIAALIASAGVAISLALQGALSNMAGGMLLMTTKPFRAGDYIIIKGTDIEGTVVKIEIYYTSIRTLVGEIVRIPNQMLTNQAVVNQAQNFTKVLVVRVGIAYSESIPRAKAVLMGLLESDPRILEDIRRVVVDGLDNSQVTMMCIARVRAEDYNSVRFDLNERIRETFRIEGIEIPFNQMDVHLKKD